MTVKNIFSYKLTFADGSIIHIGGKSEESSEFIEKMSNIMKLEKLNTEAVENTNAFKIIFEIDPNYTYASNKSSFSFFSKNDHYLTQILPSASNKGEFFANYSRSSLTFALAAQKRGGILLHGALAEWKGNGIILAAPGGTGKTTASNRLPSSWQSHCDDTTLAVKDKSGKYWAHPWPTWSRFLDNGVGGQWDVKKAVPLNQIFFLSRAEEDKTEPVNSAQAVSLIVESSKQVTSLLSTLEKNEKLKNNLERFNNICKLVKKIPVSLLHISLTGKFWEEIERTLS